MKDVSSISTNVSENDVLFMIRPELEILNTVQYYML